MLKTADLLEKIKESLRGEFAVYYLLSMLTSVLSFGTQIILGRILSVESFAVANTSIAMVTNIAVIFQPLSLLICKDIAQKKKENVIDWYIASFALSASILIVGSFLFLIKSVNSNYNFLIWVIVLVTAIAVGLISTLSAYYQGTEAFVRLAILSFLIVAVRLIFVYGIGKSFDDGAVVGVIPMLIGNGIGMLIAAPYVFKAINTRCITTINRDKIKVILSGFSSVFIANLFFSLYVNGGELILLKSMYDSKEVGYYTSVATLTKVGFFVVSSISPFVFPILSRINMTDKKRAQRLLMVIILINILITFMCGCVVVAGGNNILLYVFGKNYMLQPNLLLCVSIYYVLISVFLPIFYYMIAISREKELSIIVGIFTGLFLTAVKVLHMAMINTLVLMCIFFLMEIVILMVKTIRVGET